MSTKKQKESKKAAAVETIGNEPIESLAKTANDDFRTAAPSFLITATGVMIVNSEALGDKLTALLCETINQYKYSEITSVIIRTDNFPTVSDEPVYAMAYADTNSIAINLNRCLSGAIEKVQKDETKTSFLTCLWANILSTFGHELDHLSMARKDREDYDLMRQNEKGNAALEKHASDSAIRTIMELATKFDVEIPPIAELGWFSAEIMKIFMGDADWAVEAKMYAEAGIIYDDGKDDLISSFREYVKRSYPEADALDWEQGTSCVNINAYMVDGTREIMKAEPVLAPAIDIKVKDVEPAVAPVEGVLVPSESFIGAGTTTELDNVAEIEVEPISSDTEIEFTDPAEKAANAVITVNPAGLAVVDAVVVGTPEYVAAHAAPGDKTVIVAEAPVQPVPEVVAAQATLDNQAAAPTPAKVETTYEPHNLSDETMKAVMEAIWKRLYSHIFTKCGWSVNPTTGHYFFESAAHVLEHVGIQDILDTYKADNFIMSFDAVNQVGQGYTAEDFNGTIRGFCSSKANLPCYNLYLNVGGQRIKRSLIPQNPEKRNTENAYTDPAILAQGGQAITWIMKDEVKKGSGVNPCAVKITTILNAGVATWNYEVMS